MKTVCLKAYAKINFGLRVLPKREDGFHNIESIFQTVSVYDTLSAELTEDGKCVVECPQMELPQDNTLTKTCRAFESVTGQKIPGVKVILEKGIPSGGGLGGGSSDAACFVRILEKLTGIFLTEAQLTQIAGMVGSDVFFFSAFPEGTGCAVVTGRGEYVKPIKPRSDFYLVLVFPPKASSTPRAYALVDQILSEDNDYIYPSLEKLENVYNSPVKEWTFINTFTRAVSADIPEVEDALKDVNKTGALFTSMSGSGSTVFGLYDTEKQAEKACTFLHEKWDCIVVTPQN